jgi:signal transduction histidine kinase
VTVGRQRGGVTVEVRDDGAGIAPADLEHIFEPFFSTKDPAEGTGLGLPISRDIITGLGGTIHIESKLGAGTTVRTWLPAAQEPSFVR